MGFIIPAGINQKCSKCEAGLFTKPKGSTKCVEWSSFCDPNSNGCVNDNKGICTRKICELRDQYLPERNLTSRMFEGVSSLVCNEIGNFKSNATCKTCVGDAAQGCHYGYCRKNFDPMTGCSACLPLHYMWDCRKCPPPLVAALTDGCIVLGGLYLMMSLLYVLLRGGSDASEFIAEFGLPVSIEDLGKEKKKEKSEKKEKDKDKDENENLKRTGNMKQLAKEGTHTALKLAPAITGSSMATVLINQTQILSSIFGYVMWSPELPKELIDFLEFVKNLISIDFSAMLSSPNCAMLMPPREKWVFSMMLPLGIAGIFCVWALSARLWFVRVRKVKTADALEIDKKGYEHVLQAILQAAVYILLLGMFKTMVKMAFDIFDCEMQKDTGLLVLVMDSQLCPFAEGGDLAIGIFGIIGLLFYAIIPFGIVGMQLCRYGIRGKLIERIIENSTFRVLYGWAIRSYKPNAFMWEPLTALIKVSMVGSNVLVSREIRPYVHGGIVALSLFAHAGVRPFRDGAGNIVVIMFCVTDLLGVAAHNSHTALQIVHLVCLFLTLIAVFVYAIRAASTKVKHVRAKLKHKKKILHSKNDVDDKNKIPVIEEMQHRSSLCENMMLLPFMLIIVLPVGIASLPFLVIGIILDLLTRVGIPLFVGCMVVVPVIINIVRIFFLTPTYLFLFVCSQSFLKSLLKSFRLFSMFSAAEKSIFHLIYGKWTPFALEKIRQEQIAQRMWKEQKNSKILLPLDFDVLYFDIFQYLLFIFFPF